MEFHPEIAQRVRRVESADQALVELRAILEEEPDNRAAWAFVSRAALTLDRFQESLEASFHLTEPLSAGELSVRMFAALQLRRHDEARSAYQARQSLDGRVSMPWLLRLWGSRRWLANGITALCIGAIILHSIVAGIVASAAVMLFALWSNHVPRHPHALLGGAAVLAMTWGGIAIFAAAFRRLAEI